MDGISLPATARTYNATGVPVTLTYTDPNDNTYTWAQPQATLQDNIHTPSLQPYQEYTRSLQHSADPTPTTAHQRKLP